MDPYHGDPWAKRGRKKWGDSQAARDGNTAQLRQTRKKARRQLKLEAQQEQAQMIDESIKDGTWSDLSDEEYWSES